MTTTIDETTPADVLWGAEAIAKAIGQSERATYHLLANKLLPAKRIGGRWVASRQKLIEALIGESGTAA
jgi:hypothetical protein